MMISWILWVKIMSEEYEIVLSDVVFNEIQNCPQPKREFLNYFVKHIKYTLINRNRTIIEIADEVVSQGILNMNSYKDCLHIATAVYSGCDYLLSWNLDDLAKIKTVKGVLSVTTLLGSKDLDIITPETLLNMEEK
jgi:predicted nucleic acid-binding protein